MILLATIDDGSMHVAGTDTDDVEMKRLHTVQMNGLARIAEDLPSGAHAMRSDFVELRLGEGWAAVEDKWLFELHCKHNEDGPT